MRRQLAAALLGAALLTGGAQAVAEPPAARYVADEADVLSSETEQYIIDKNQSLFENTGGEIVVVSVDFMDGMDAADYAMAVAESWGGIGDESLNNGFLLVYAVGENKVWAMAGSGIEDALPASKIEGWLEADFYGGYDAGEYDSATRAFFDDVYGWYESYYGTSAARALRYRQSARSGSTMQVMGQSFPRRAAKLPSMAPAKLPTPAWRNRWVGICPPKSSSCWNSSQAMVV